MSANSLTLTTSKGVVSLTPSHTLPCHLADKQIVGLMSVCFNFQFVQMPSLHNGTVSLFVRRDEGTDWGFWFWFQVKCLNKVKNYQGTVFGSDDLYLSMGCYKNGKLIQTSDWEDNFSIPVRQVYQYLESIYYFNDTLEMPVVNPNVDQTEWVMIYTKKY